MCSIVYTLLIDSGNTYTKLITLQGDEVLERLRISGNVREAVVQIQTESHPQKSFTRAEWQLLYSSVASPQKELETFLRERADYVLILGSDTPVPLKEIRYNRSTLGVDRLAVAVAAFNRSHPAERNALVIDIGTAITYDFITYTGIFMGGTISPGPQIRLRALHEFTGRLPMVDLTPNPDPAMRTPHSTPQAIAQGVGIGIIFEVQQYINNTLIDKPKTDIYLTGGWAPYFADQLKNVTFALPELQMEGLKSILAYNHQ